MSSSQPLDFATLLAASVHDMKNAIGLLVPLVAELREEVEGHDAAFDQLQSETSRLNNYLVQLMTLYKLERDQYYSQQHEVYLDEFLEDVEVANRPLLAARGIEVECRADDGLCWDFDGPLVQGVLGTVLNNVLGHARHKVQLSAESVGDELCLQVEDDGDGFPDEMLGELAERQMGVDFVSGSTGFGLYFALQVARLHGSGERCGRIRLSNDSALGGGCFQLFLP